MNRKSILQESGFHHLYQRYENYYFLNHSELIFNLITDIDSMQSFPPPDLSQVNIIVVTDLLVAILLLKIRY